MDLSTDEVKKIRLRNLASAAFLGALLGLVALPAAAGTLRVELGRGEVAALTEDQQLYLEVLPERGEGLLGLARRTCGSSTVASVIAEANGGVERLLAGVRYRVPFAVLVPERQLKVMRALFERDEVASGGWSHRVGRSAANGRESLWAVAEWFTGRGDNYREIRDFNRIVDDHLEPGQTLVIPARLLRPALRSALPESSQYYLEYGRDGDGDFAVYRLKAGEALYSSVVVRFTGRVFAEDVNSLALAIAERSGIADVTEIPVGYAVKIPLDLLQPEFLPEGDPRRREYELGLVESSRFSNPVRAERLRGVTVILDAGHGGSDVGASMGGVWESVYVYDILMRVMKLLAETTAAETVATVRDGADYAVHDRDVLPYSRGHRVLTDPHYPIADSTVGLHLRWYLTNSIYRRLLERGGDSAEVVFLSIHADSLHPSLRGAMAYVPGARYRTGQYGKSGAVYAARKEVREHPTVSFSSRERVRSEGLSRDLAQNVIAAFSDGDLLVHPDKPIREKVVRNRRAWVPAVLRYNAVPAQLLLEVCNLANEDDRKLLQTRDFRQRVADAIVRGIVDYYGDGEEAKGLRLARSAS